MYKELSAELRNVSAEIDKYRESNSCEEQDMQIAELIHILVDVTRFCRRESILRLEDGIKVLEGRFPYYNLLKKLAFLVVIGTDPKLIREIAVSEYYSLNLHAYDALIVMIYLEFVRHVQKGVNPDLVEELLLSLVPFTCSFT